jgi:hypothetical protein
MAPYAWNKAHACVREPGARRAGQQPALRLRQQSHGRCYIAVRGALLRGSAALHQPAARLSIRRTSSAGRRAEEKLTSERSRWKRPDTLDYDNF